MAQEIALIQLNLEEKIPKQKVQQYDSGRILRFELYDKIGDVREPLDLTDNIIVLTIKKPDNTICFCVGSVIGSGQDGMCEVELTEQATSAVGPAKAQLMLTGSKVVRTAEFDIEILSSLDNDSAIESSDDFSSLMELVQTLQQNAVGTQIMFGTEISHAGSFAVYNAIGARVDDLYINKDSYNLYRCVDVDTSLDYPYGWQYIGCLKGEDGNPFTYDDFTEEQLTALKGEAGSPGYTPIRGTDYWTEEDQAAITNDAHTYIAEELAKRGQVNPEFVNSIEECTDTTKLYVLPDGYIYAYMKKIETSTEKAYTNIFDREKVLLNARFNSAHTLVSDNGCFVTRWYPVPDNFATEESFLYVKGVDVTSDNTNKIALKNDDSSDTPVVGESALASLQFNLSTNLGIKWETIDAKNHYYKIDLRKNGAGNVHTYISNIKSFCFAQRIGTTALTADKLPDLILSYEPIEETTSTDTVTGWFSTGLAFIPADYEDRIVDLETSSDSYGKRITYLENKASNNNPESEEISVPTYWNNAIIEAVEKVKNIQDQGGKDIVNFVWFSDMHYGGSPNYVGNIGALCRAVMDKCDIPLTLMNGDALTAGVLSSDTAVLSMLEGAMDILAPIGNGLMLVRGNHDDVYGSYSDGNTTAYYVNKVAQPRVWNKLHRPQANDFRRVFGGDGTYFYLDNLPQKIRFVCLNSHFYDGEAITNGTTNGMSIGFGTDQLDWLEKKALNIDDDWSAVVTFHVPTIAAYATEFSGTDYVDFRNIITASTADIIGIFCGHIHRDNIYINDLPCPIITVTCAVNTPYDGTASERVAGTDKETAVDIVSIDKTKRKIYTTRLGAGDDREISY